MKHTPETGMKKFLNFTRSALAAGGMGVFMFSMYQLAWGSVPLPKADSALALPSILEPTEDSLEDDSLVIVLDPGHGGRDPGAPHGDLIEKDINLDISRRVRTRLEKRGQRVVMTRSGDHQVELVERAAMANRYKNVLFVSIHQNGAITKGAGGVETFFTWPKPSSVMNRQRDLYKLPEDAQHEDERSRMLAERVHQAFCQTTGATDRGVKNKSLSVTRNVHGPSILVECGFLTNKEDAERIRSDRYRDRISDGIAAGIMTYVDESAGDLLYGLYFPHGKPSLAVK